jgi:hypothetical protein
MVYKGVLKMKKALIFWVFICFGAMYSFGEDTVFWTTANVGWVRKYAGPSTPVISKTAARAKILQYCETYKYYNYLALDFVNPGDEGQVYISARGLIGEDVMVAFVNKDRSEGITFSNETYGYSQIMNKRTIERIIDSWFR